MKNLSLSLLLSLLLIGGVQAQSFFKMRNRYHRPYISRAITGAVEQKVPQAHGAPELRAAYVDADHAADNAIVTKDELRRELRRSRREQRRAARASIYLASVKAFNEELYLGPQLAERQAFDQPMGL